MRLDRFVLGHDRANEREAGELIFARWRADFDPLWLRRLRLNRWKPDGQRRSIIGTPRLLTRQPVGHRAPEHRTIRKEIVGVVWVEPAHDWVVGKGPHRSNAQITEVGLLGPSDRHTRHRMRPATNNPWTKQPCRSSRPFRRVQHLRVIHPMATAARCLPSRCRPVAQQPGSIRSTEAMSSSMSSLGSAGMSRGLILSKPWRQRQLPPHIAFCSASLPRSPSAAGSSLRFDSRQTPRFPYRWGWPVRVQSSLPRSGCSSAGPAMQSTTTNLPSPLSTSRPAESGLPPAFRTAWSRHTASRC